MAEAIIQVNIKSGCGNTEPILGEGQGGWISPELCCDITFFHQKLQIYFNPDFFPNPEQMEVKSILLVGKGVTWNTLQHMSYMVIQFEVFCLFSPEILLGLIKTPSFRVSESETWHKISTT